MIAVELGVIQITWKTGGQEWEQNHNIYSDSVRP